MNLKKLNTLIQKPRIYEKGDSIMWTDDYISKQLLEIHLNPEIDLASRKRESIERTVEFIQKFCRKQGMNILDLGCGPGIYLEKFSELGHKTTGVDFSKNSIKYAREQANKKGLKIKYVCQDYLEIDYENQFDLIIQIYTDFGVLIPEERERLLEKVYKALKPKGIFIFDIINNKNVERKFEEQSTWKIEESGFWSPNPYLELAKGFNYQKEQVFLSQYTIINEKEDIKNYRFWTHYFNSDAIQNILSVNKFKKIEYYESVLLSTSIWDGDNITFYKTEK